MARGQTNLVSSSLSLNLSLSLSLPSTISIFPSFLPPLSSLAAAALITSSIIHGNCLSMCVRRFDPTLRQGGLDWTAASEGEAFSNYPLRERHCTREFGALRIDYREISTSDDVSHQIIDIHNRWNVSSPISRLNPARLGSL